MYCEVTDIAGPQFNSIMDSGTKLREMGGGGGATNIIKLTVKGGVASRVALCSI